MSSLLPTPLPPKATMFVPVDPASKTTRKKVAPARSARRVKNGTVSSETNGTYVVRVTVLGLAGITVNRSKCRSSSGDDVGLPAPPSKMRAVVAFSRNSAIRGTTTLSKKLKRSPTNDVVLAATESGEELTVAGKSGDDTATHTTKGSGGTQRQVAVWASDDNTALGSTVTFDATLHRSDSDGIKSTATSSAFAPKSFELTIALTDGDNSDQAVVALPLGVASLAISGEESSKGKTTTVDLPVYSLSQARPIGSSDRMGTYPMITLAPRQMAAEPVETIPGATPLKKKRTGLKKLFSKKDKNNTILASIPSVAKRDAFAAAYSMDSGGDAILRVILEVYKKEASSDILSLAPANKLSTEYTSKSNASKSNAVESRKNDSNRLYKAVDEKKEETSADQESGDGTEITEETECTDLTEYSDDETDLTGSILTLDDETITLDGSMVNTEDNRIAFFSWVNGPSRNNGKDKECRRGGRKKGQRPSFFVHEDDEGMVSINVLGQTIRFPSCVSLEVPDTDGRSRYGDSTVADDLTHITADFFGKSYQIPICVGIAKKESDDDDSTASYIEENVMPGSRIANVLNGEWCQSKGMESKEIKISSTFSTLSEHDAVRETKKITVSNAGNAWDESRVTNEAEIPAPSEWGEADEIMRIVRSKPSRSPKDGVARKPVERPVAATDVSPKGEVDYVLAETEAPTTPKARIVKSIAELFHCQRSQNLGPLGPHYEPFEPEVPSIIIHLEHDLHSVGELTLTTHEQNIAAEASLLDRARQIFNENPPQRINIHKEEKRGKGMVCVSGGFCSPLVKHDTVSSPIRISSYDSSSIVEGHQSHHSREKYISNCDENTTFSPVEVEKVSSVEKGSPFSRVRDPSEDKSEPGIAPDGPAGTLYSNTLPVYSSIPGVGGSLSAKTKVEIPVLSLYSDSLPVYSSMGVGDGTESLLGAFTNSNNERDGFNPMTGVEVDQAIIECLETRF